MTDFYDVMTLRRSNYSLDDRVELSEPQIMELINHAVKQCPSAEILESDAERTRKSYA